MVVEAPGGNGPASRVGQAVEPACGDERDILQPQDGDGSEATGSGFAVAELTEVVGSPGPDGAVVEQGESVVTAGGDGLDVGQAGHGDGNGTAGFAAHAVAELTEVVAAPGPDGAVIEQRQTVLTAGGDGLDVVQTGHADGKGAANSGLAVAELTEVVA